jgi:hypothetical protein
MTPEMVFECLLISRDPAVYCTINKVLRNFSITVDHSLSSSKACDVVIGKRTHDLVVIDWEGEPSTELLHTIWSLHTKRKPTLVAIADEDSSVPGVHLTLRKPVTIESGTAFLKNAYSRMLLDHRLHARYAIMTSLLATDRKGREFPVKVTDIGDRGVGLNCKLELTVGDELSFALKLAGTARPINLQVRVVWTREYGMAGCEFLNIPPVDRDILREWLKAKLYVKKPIISV